MRKYNCEALWYRREGKQLNFHISRHIAHLGWETKATHAQARIVVFPWTPNFQFILDITSDSEVFPTHQYELWISEERYINVICENFQFYGFYTFFSLCEWTFDSNQNEANMAAPM